MLLSPSSALTHLADTRMLLGSLLKKIPLPLPPFLLLSLSFLPCPPLLSLLLPLPPSSPCLFPSSPSSLPTLLFPACLPPPLLVGADCDSPCRGNHEMPFSSVQSLSRVRLFATSWTAACQASLSITRPKLMSIESVMPSNHLILCCPFLPSTFPSIRVFSSESVLRIRWPKYWSFIFNISPSNEYSGPISFRMDWFDIAVQGTLKSLTVIMRTSQLSHTHTHTE